MKSEILITGGKGFIGRKLAGKKFSGRTENLKSLLAQAKGVKGIVHLAAVSYRRACDADPLKCVKSNLLGLINVLETAKRKKIWLIFISTYQIREQHLYGLTKLLGEELCRLYQKQGVKIKIIRLPIVYGPNDRPDKVVTKIINQIKNGIEPTINTDEKFFFTYVDDAAKIIENEVDILLGGGGRKYSLRDLTKGIRECLK